MKKSILAIFSDEAAARTGARRLKELGAENSNLFSSFTVVVRTSDGKLHVAESAPEGLGAAAAGALIGALAGFPAGGLMAGVLGASAGALVGISADLLKRRDFADLLDKLTHELSPGKAAIVGEVPEDRLDDFYARMEAVGGTVVWCGSLA